MEDYFNPLARVIATPERLWLFRNGLPTIHWLEEKLLEDEPFEVIVSRYFLTKIYI